MRSNTIVAAFFVCFSTLAVDGFSVIRSRQYQFSSIRLGAQKGGKKVSKRLGRSEERLGRSEKRLGRSEERLGRSEDGVPEIKPAFSISHNQTWIIIFFGTFIYPVLRPVLTEVGRLLLQKIIGS